jgi:eukaryotic-like serine/threonine-protein kinase
MALTPGTKLGPYEIHSPLGAGGMGEVYRARDTRLERDVAVKVLPANLSSDPNLRQRLEREAKAVSKLSHPHICTLHDIGHQDGVDFLVMELVEGESLEQRLMKGPLPPDRALRIAAQIAGALAKAHKLGFVHRDLKPANVMLTKTGAKLMDFGLAKQSGRAPLTAALTEMTMEQAKLTSEGMLVGTFQYMAPEQLEGKEADPRTDIFSLGELIYEMATGKPAFFGKSRASLIAAILTAEPQPMANLQPMTPLALERVVKKCLAKDPDERWQSASDLASELNWITEAGSQSDGSIPQPAKRTKRERWIWICAVAILLAALAGLYFRTSPNATQPTWSSILAPENTSFAYFAGPVAVSHDGRALTFVATNSAGQDMVWMRPLGELKARAVAGTEGASNPFWSPDDRSIGFFAGGKLKTTDSAGGPVVTICDVAGSRGGSWSQKGVIVFAATWGGLHRVPSSGGTPDTITTLDRSRGELSHRWPYFLPDGHHFFYLAANFSGGSAESASVYLADLGSKESKLLFHARSNAVYTPGHILFVRDRTLMAQPFDEKPMEIRGQPFPIAEQVQYDELVWRGVFSSSFNGVLAYQGGNTGANSRLIMLDRAGKEVKAIGAPGDFISQRISPNGQQLAVSVLDASVRTYKLWLYDLSRDKQTRLSFGPGRTTFPVWSPDGSRIGFASNQTGRYQLVEKRSDGTGSEEPILESDISKYPTAWSADGRFIAYNTTSPGKYATELWILPLFGERKPYPFLRGSFDVGQGRFSPDGRWMAYSSDESGRGEVYVTPFPGGGSKFQVSAAGGSIPRWRRDGKELFYLAADSELMAAEVDGSGSSFQVATVRPLFHLLLKTGIARLDLEPTSDQISYDAGPDGKWFVVNAPPIGNSPPITLITDWTPGLGK